MLPAIRIEPARPNDIMAPTSRINFGKHYTVEHNLAVYEFGNVRSEFLGQLKANAEYVWSIAE